VMFDGVTDLPAQYLEQTCCAFTLCSLVPSSVASIWFGTPVQPLGPVDGYSFERCNTSTRLLAAFLLRPST
jgi:hypothetical protein